MFTCREIVIVSSQSSSKWRGVGQCAGQVVSKVRRGIPVLEFGKAESYGGGWFIGLSPSFFPIGIGLRLPFLLIRISGLSPSFLLIRSGLLQ